MNTKEIEQLEVEIITSVDAAQNAIKTIRMTAQRAENRLSSLMTTLEQFLSIVHGFKNQDTECAVDILNMVATVPKVNKSELVVSIQEQLRTLKYVTQPGVEMNVEILKLLNRQEARLSRTTSNVVDMERWSIIKVLAKVEGSLHFIFLDRPDKKPHCWKMKSTELYNFVEPVKNYAMLDTNPFPTYPYWETAIEIGDDEHARWIREQMKLERKNGR